MGSSESHFFFPISSSLHNSTGASATASQDFLKSRVFSLLRNLQWLPTVLLIQHNSHWHFLFPLHYSQTTLTHHPVLPGLVLLISMG